MTGPARARLAALPLLVAAMACDSTTEGHPTTIGLTADRTTADIGETITFRYEATGQRLAGVVVEFGDGGADSVPTFGAQTATGNVEHAYDVAGSFTVIAEVIEFAGPTATEALAVEILDGSTP